MSYMFYKLSYDIQNFYFSYLSYQQLQILQMFENSVGCNLSVTLRRHLWLSPPAFP